MYFEKDPPPPTGNGDRECDDVSVEQCKGKGCSVVWCGVAQCYDSGVCSVVYRCV